jgi:hypothetical protein
VRLDLELLRLVDDEEPTGAIIAGRSRMRGQTRTHPFTSRLSELGFDSPAAARSFLNATDVLNSRAGAVSVRDDLIYASAGARAPACDAPDFSSAVAEIRKRVTDPLAGAMLDTTLQAYKGECETYLAQQRELKDALGPGAISRVHGEWQSARAALAAQRARARELEQALKRASAEYEAAVETDRKASTSQTQARLKQAAEALHDGLTQAGQASELVGVPALAESRVEAIDTVLTALAGDRIDADKVSEPDLQRAARVAERIPALVGEIEVLTQQRRAPAVSPLVIEKQHQLLLRDDALRRVNIMVQRMALLETKYNALVAEARALLAQRDGICNVLQPADSRSRIPCDTLTAAITEETTADKKIIETWTCSYDLESSDGATARLSHECTGKLAVPWAQTLRTGSAAEKRAAWEALAGLGRRLAIARPQQDEADFRLAHLTHLDVAASDEFAIRAWDALIATPINQLAAYHQTGIKPAELADLIIKAIGLGAIGVGVNR